MRSRTFANLSGFEKIYWYQRAPGTTAWVPQSTPSSSTPWSLYDRLDDVVTPHFRKREAAGEIIVNDMEHVKSSLSGGGGQVIMTATGGNYSYKYVGDRGSVSAAWASVCGVSPSVADSSLSFSPEEIAIVKAKAIADLNSSPVYLGEDFLEIRKSLKLMRHPFQEVNREIKRVAKGLHDLRRMTKGMKKDQLKQLEQDWFSQAWLKGRFIYHNAYLSALNVQKAIAARPEEVRRTARGRYAATANIASDILVQNWSGQECTFTRNYVNERALRAGIIYSVSDPINSLGEKAGLRLQDLPAEVWAVQPASWVLDRFIDVQKSIRGLCAFVNPNVTIHAGWVTSRAYSFHSVSLRGIKVAGYNVTVVPDATSYTYENKKRVVWQPTVLDSLGMLNSTKFKSNIRQLNSDLVSSLDVAAFATGRLKKLLRTL